jgi:hypothetical protein
MNERIKELIFETDEWLEDNAQSDRWEREIKFAELIVKECADIADDFDEGLDIYLEIIKRFGISL